MVKWKRLARVSVSPKFDAAATINLSVEKGTLIKAQGSLDSLRLDYPILDKIKLEKIANKQIGNKAQYIFDASKLAATVPVIEGRFGVSKVSLPKDDHGVQIDVKVSQIK